MKALLLVVVLMSAGVVRAEGDGTKPQSPEPGLLFSLSGDHGLRADYAAGKAEPNYAKDVRVRPGGVKGEYIECGNDQIYSYWAPGNIHAQRGTLSFFWRARMAVDETEFPVFRVGYGDHSSWDMVWLRIDYNGHGFDAFVTDVNLGRTRVSYTLPAKLKADEWVHLTLGWDETSGIRFFVNGKLAGEKAATGMFDAALDQFGPHSRIIAPSGVESTYNYDRGGDIDELKIYDRMLSDANVASLAKGYAVGAMPDVPHVDAAARMAEWKYRYGWNAGAPAELPAKVTTVRKVEIHDAYDLKRWWWKGTDGIRETTWPGVYNRSRLVGRLDYFQLPDWDCYSLSGKSVTFTLPEAWNHLEIQGGAWGEIASLKPGAVSAGAVADPDQHDVSPQIATKLFARAKGQERTFHDVGHDVGQAMAAGNVRFTNVEQEWPIGEFAAYNVHAGAEPAGVATLRYTLTTRGALDNPSLDPLVEFVEGRFAADERATMVAMPGVALGGGRTAIGGGRRTAAAAVAAGAAQMPIVHIFVPADFRGLAADAGHGTSYGWENMHAGLDGIAIDLPALKVKPTHGELVAMNVQIKDPVWPMRDMLDFSFSVKPGEAHTLWLDTRDRLLPNGKSLYITIASASPEFGVSALEGAAVRLVFKPWKEALPEHVADRLTQVRDNYANMVEESVNSRKLNLFNRFDADITDLLRVDPENDLGRKYWNEMNHEQLRPPFVMAEGPKNVPRWAYLQTEDLKRLKWLIDWYVDNRQISNGEFGGGLSDDSDFLNWWPGLALMGAEPEKLKGSLLKTLDTMYAQNMFTNGVATAQYDELHAYEDGINVVAEAMMIDYGSPKQIERAMETSRTMERLTGYNSAGQRQMRSAFYSGTKMAENGVWGWGKDRSYMVLHPSLLLVNYNGTPRTRKIITEVADGFLAHRRMENGRMAMHFSVNFHTNEDKPSGGGMTPWFVLWGAYKFTGDLKYIAPFGDEPASALRTINADALDVLKVRDTWGKELLTTAASERRTDSGTPSETNMHLRWQMTGDLQNLEQLYAQQIETAENRKFINTEGSLWIDRIYFNNGELQRARLGGVALARNQDFPGNVVSWKFDAPATDGSVAILIPEGAPEHVKAMVYNLDAKTVTARMTGAEVEPGTWEITQGVQAREGGAVTGAKTWTATFERGSDLELSFAPGVTTVLDMKLVTKGVPYWSRPDLGIDREDVMLAGDVMSVTVHSLGAVDTAAAKVVVRDRGGKVLASAPVPVMAAPSDLVPKRQAVSVRLPSGASLRGASVTVEMEGTTPEITLKNNRVMM